MKAALWLWLLAVAAGAAEVPSPWQVRADLQIVRLPQVRALVLVPALLEEKTAPAAYAEIQRAIDAGEIQLVADLSGRALAGKWTVVEDTGETERYPLEFLQDDARVAAPVSPAGAGKEERSMSYPAHEFETRRCGASLGFEPTVLAGGKVVEINCSTSWQALDGWVRYESARRKDGMTIYAPKPRFINRRAAGPLLLKPGLPLVHALYQLPGVPAMMELHLLTVHVRDLTGFPISPAEPAPELRVPSAWQTRGELHLFRVPQAEALALRSQLQDERGMESGFARASSSGRRGRAKSARTAKRAWFAKTSANCCIRSNSSSPRFRRILALCRKDPNLAGPRIHPRISKRATSGRRRNWNCGWMTRAPTSPGISRSPRCCSTASSAGHSGRTRTAG
jgi:hypothetical protein